jgi:hypothetical protein
MSKAHDRVEWQLLEDMMRKLGFQKNYDVCVCVTMVSYMIKINNSYSYITHPQRGLRQTDPLSRYLFLICGEALSCHLNKAGEDGQLEGVRVCAEAPSFNHLFIIGSFKSI